MKERFLDNTRIWLVFESERFEKLFLEVWEALPAGERDFLKDRISKVSDQFERLFKQLKRSKSTIETGCYHPATSAIVIDPVWGAKFQDSVIRYIFAHELGHAFSYLSCLSLIGEIEKNKGPMESGERDEMITRSQDEEFADLAASEWGFPRPERTLPIIGKSKKNS